MLQALHVGSFDQEEETFEKLFAYAEKHDLKAIHKEFHHREIYISDFRKTAAEKLKTTVRIFVEKEQEK
nr:GyrI-like domain-containing protein [Lactococcus cremoris]